MNDVDEYVMPEPVLIEEIVLDDDMIVESQNESTSSNKIDDILTVIEIDKRKTNNVLSTYEFTQCISLRATAIENGSTIYTDYTGLHDPIKIAMKEFYEKKIPYILVRKVKCDNNKVYVEKFKLINMTYFGNIPL